MKPWEIDDLELVDMAEIRANWEDIYWEDVREGWLEDEE